MHLKILFGAEKVQTWVATSSLLWTFFFFRYKHIWHCWSYPYDLYIINSPAYPIFGLPDLLKSRCWTGQSDIYFQMNIFTSSHYPLVYLGLFNRNQFVSFPRFSETLFMHIIGNFINDRDSNYSKNVNQRILCNISKNILKTLIHLEMFSTENQIFLEGCKVTWV